MVWEEGGINLAPLPDYMTQKNNMGWYYALWVDAMHMDNMH